jgi:hypothetical protein
LKPNVEPKSVTEARNLFWAANDLLYSSKIQPLEIKFKQNPKVAFNDLAEFLFVDVVAYRCGYAKEIFLHWLKHIDFSFDEIKKLQSLVISVCETKSFRREFRRWCRLAVKIADSDFVIELKKLKEGENHFAKVKSGWMLEMIQQNRLDLLKEINENQR